MSRIQIAIAEVTDQTYDAIRLSGGDVLQTSSRTYNVTMPEGTAHDQESGSYILPCGLRLSIHSETLKLARS